ncbi:MAG: class I SAM-dependent methyltransferase family protein [Candidatus Thorarchaeota archaeon]|nr:MAG: class I SAM-dependent methyltransferase family protein [Candidatus Thorarchaeota archaeon]
MSSEKQYVSVPAKDGETIRKLLLTFEILDSWHKIFSEDKILYFPIKSEITKDQLSTLNSAVPVDTGIRIFDAIPQDPRTIVDALEGKIPPEKLALLPRAYDLIGDIAVLEIPDEISSYSELIGEVFHNIHSNFKTVLAKKGAISGTTRVREYTILAGEDRTKTIHTEYGCRLAVDVAKAYFSPRLLEEHNRIAQLVQSGEIVVDMFCGVGPFAIHIAKKTEAKVIAIDINQSAIDLLCESIGLNKLVGTILPIVADAHDYVNTHALSVDRVIMNHPSGASDFVGDVCSILKSGGTMHYYDFIGGDTPEDALKEKVIGLVEKEDRQVKKIDLIRRVRDSAPYEFQMVADVIIQE